MAKTVTLKHKGFYFQGVALLNHWGGGQGKVNMDSWQGESDDREEVLKGVNDGQFGCESIESAEVDVYDVYDGGYREFKKTIHFKSDDLEGATRGI